MLPEFDYDAYPWFPKGVPVGYFCLPEVKVITMIRKGWINVIFALKKGTLSVWLDRDRSQPSARLVMPWAR